MQPSDVRQPECESPFCLPLSQKMEDFSKSFVRAISSVAGYSVEETQTDYDSIDLTIYQRGSEENYPKIEGLRVQTKCTYSHEPNGGFLRYPLSIKNYNDLRRDTLNPRILVVVCVPEDVDSWLCMSDEFIALHYSGYWKSLFGATPTDNQRTITVKIPTDQQFSVENLKSIMDRLSVGEKP